MTSSISGVTGTSALLTASGSSPSTAQNTGMSGLVQPNTFLNLLVDEMKYQDPLNPTSSSNFMAQLAQLSQVEQLSTVSASMRISEAANLIGKSVTGVDEAGNQITGTVTGVTNGSNGPTLTIGSNSMTLSSVSQISG